MPSAAHLRLQIEAALADRIPSALTPAPRVLRPTAPTGIPTLDAALHGGFPLGAITELSGPECSGRTSLALSFLACLTNDNRVCAWVDVSDTLHPESAAAAGIDLARLLWIRCGPEPEQLALPGFGENPSPIIPETSLIQDQEKVSISVTNPPIPQNYAPRCAEPQPTVRKKTREAVSRVSFLNSKLQARNSSSMTPRRPWSKLDQALRAADLLLNAGGFSAIVLDMGSIAPEFALRVPLATWFRYRAAAERTQASVLLLTQQPCTQSSAGLVLQCRPGNVAPDSTTVFTGAENCIQIARQRFAKTSNLVDFSRRKPPQSDPGIRWQTRTPWAAFPPAPPAKAGRP